MISRISAEDKLDYFIGSRWIDDHRSWVIKFSDMLVEAPPPTPLSQPLRCDPVSATNWALLDQQEPFISYRVLPSSSLHYNYIVSDLELVAHLREKLWRFLFAEDVKESGRGYSSLTSVDKYNIRVW